MNELYIYNNFIWDYKFVKKIILYCNEGVSKSLAAEPEVLERAGDINDGDCGGDILLNVALSAFIFSKNIIWSKCFHFFLSSVPAPDRGS